MSEETLETCDSEEVVDVEYVGEKKVESVVVDKLDLKFVFVKLEGEEEPLRLHSHVYDIIKSDKPEIGSAYELKWSGLAKEFLKVLQEYDTPFWEVAMISTNMQNHVANAHNEATTKLWGKTESKRTISDIDKVLKA